MVHLKYKGRKPELKLRHPSLAKEYDFTPESNMACEVADEDAKRLMAENPGTFEVIGAKPDAQAPAGGSTQEPAQAGKVSAASNAQPEAPANGAGAQGQTPEPGPAVPQTFDPRVVAAAKEAMQKGGYKLPPNASKPETIMAHYEKFIAQKAQSNEGAEG